ncbi:uncharacterized protein LOC143250531 isoform X4 [Tachypleus tridentatus]|uniref:uncharacterized protein LOC143250531 isoform X4 n=1 Tax=Tachypleus tridentatus TaxID=6853 RepID=UPI003FD1918A
MEPVQESWILINADAKYCTLCHYHSSLKRFLILQDNIMSDTTKLSCTVYRKESQDYDIIKNFGTGKSKSTEQVKSMVFNNMRKKKGSLDVIINSLMNMRLLQMIIPDINGADFYLAI